ncbi:hypothetical protein ABS751_00655 [Bacillus subtilis]
MKMTNTDFSPMKHYQPVGNPSCNQEHILLYTFQYEDANAQVITSMTGNVSGGHAMMTEFDTGFTVPVDHELTKKHVEFLDGEDIAQPYREVGNIIFHYPDGETISLEIEECSNYLTGIQIVDYQP